MSTRLLLFEPIKHKPISTNDRVKVISNTHFRGHYGIVKSMGKLAAFVSLDYYDGDIVFYLSELLRIEKRERMSTDEI